MHTWPQQCLVADAIGRAGCCRSCGTGRGIGQAPSPPPPAAGGTRAATDQQHRAQNSTADSFTVWRRSADVVWSHTQLRKGDMDYAEHRGKGVPTSRRSGIGERRSSIRIESNQQDAKQDVNGQGDSSQTLGGVQALQRRAQPRCIDGRQPPHNLQTLVCRTGKSSGQGEQDAWAGRWDAAPLGNGQVALPGCSCRPDQEPSSRVMITDDCQPQRQTAGLGCRLRSCGGSRQQLPHHC